MERTLAAVLTTAVVLAFGCSFSNSSETISDSISSPFEWSSDSSDSSSESSSDAATSYRQDVSDYTVAYAKNGAQNGDDLEAFRAGVRALAETRGIVDWEADALTCAGIGRGLRDAEMTETDAFDFGRRLLGDGSVGFEAFRAGYARLQ